MADVIGKQDENYSEEAIFHAGQSPQGGQSSTNSHHHDSEYDTASELDGDDYDDESLGADEEDDLDDHSAGEENCDNVENFVDSERQRGDGQEQNNDHPKKVDEDRSNPQYIPKRGTFYEHDDRTADEPEQNVNKCEEGGDSEVINLQAPVTSLASKTMKKWQPASAVDRWSHDRYDENEQAPKSRAELVSAYGYDIRSEEGPPRARRRRRYGRGPSRYVRNWEDESAYIKQSIVSQRKPRPEEFPALGDREKKGNKKVRNYREEKENHYSERYNDKTSGSRNFRNRRDRDRINNNRDNDKHDKQGGNGGGKNFHQGMEFKNKNKINENRNLSFNRDKEESNVFHHDDRKPQVESISFTNTKASSSSNSYNNSVVSNNNRFNGHDINIPTKIQPAQITKDKISSINCNTISSSGNRPIQQSPQQQSQLQSKLQQINRNEATTSTLIGNLQMHSLASQNQNLIGELPQNTSETARTAKRYSSLRQRSQAESNLQPPRQTQQTQLDHHSLHQIQQLHEHHQQTQNTSQPQHVLLQDQHLLQANLMQLYHSQQENLQAQMQGVSIQSLPTVSGVQSHQTKPQYQNVQQQYQANPTPTAPPQQAYYTSSNEYTPTAPPQAIQQQFSQQQQATYMQQQPSAPQLNSAYNTQAQPTPQPPAPQSMPSSLNFVQTPATSNPTAPPPYQNYSNFQNYNTVGGTTYFVPHQPQSRSIVPPQRRPTNAIPILAPPNIDKSKKPLDKDDENNKLSSVCVGGNSSISSNAPVGSAENIDHILDNMFVQRPPYQPPTRKSSSPATELTGVTMTMQLNISENNDNNNDQPQQQYSHSGSIPLSGINTVQQQINDNSKLEDGIKKMSLVEEKINQECTASSPTSIEQQQITSTGGETG